MDQIKPPAEPKSNLTEIDTARVEKLELLFRKLKEWQKDPSNVNYQPIMKLVDELDDQDDD